MHKAFTFGSMIRITRITSCWAGKFCLRNLELVGFRLRNMESWFLESGMQHKKSGISESKTSLDSLVWVDS